MVRRARRKSRFNAEQIIAILKESDAGVETGELCRRHGITRACFYRWKSKFGGVGTTPPPCPERGIINGEVTFHME
jgi:transposase-like protein